MWLVDKLKHKRAPMLARTMELVVAVLLLALMLSVVFGTMVDQIRSVILLVLLNYFILALWRVLGRPTILMMASSILWLFAAPLVLNSQSLGGAFTCGKHIRVNRAGQYGTLLVAFVLTFQLFTVIEKDRAPVRLCNIS